jgi:valyl-tRNA synthetase
MSHELPKAYEPGKIEARWAEYWAEQKLFSARTPAPGDADAARPVFTVLLPPPNVTGRLHMGHMLNHTQMDIIVRWHRMRGYRTLWLPGTDHAGIATQMMVERQLQSEGKSRRGLGREAFLDRVWQWKQLYGGAILEQMKRLGDSVDWDRLYFTMDEGLSRAVIEVFVRLYEEGLIYRGKYIVNWCPRCATAISDLEVVHEEHNGKLYLIRYPVLGLEDFIVVATTRPETMLGDVAVAVHPNDARYTHMHGKVARLPLMNRDIPIITDELANPEFGTGAVKVTPAHDPNDFQAGLRHLLPQIDVMDDTGHMNENAGKYAGLDRFEARARVLEDLEKEGLLFATKDHVFSLGRCDRCKTIVEPRLSTQWFVKVAPLAQRAIEAAEEGEVVFIPENYGRTYFEWMRNIHDWCISRQLWWGHRIPAWHCRECKSITVARAAPKACPKCRGEIRQDDDVLDTWFSSGLLPFTTLGWPEKTRDLEVFYPTSLLITAYEILFFWVARMIMMGCHFMHGHPGGSVPFRQVYIHALVRDAERQKMSKTKGNTIDPIEIIDRYGTDAVRFTLAAMAAPGTDIAFNEKRTEGYRAFANKIWNAARFIFMNLDRARNEGWWSLEEWQARAGNAAPLRALEDRWIGSRFHRVAGEVNGELAIYRFDEAAHRVYDFFWHEFCDWYVELVKLRLTAGAGPEEKEAAREALYHLVTVFEGALRMLSPFMPFLTEELWQAFYRDKAPRKSIALGAYPQSDPKQVDLAAETEMAVLQDLIVNVRAIRADLKVEPKTRTPIRIFAEPEGRRLVEQNHVAVEKLSGVEGITFVESSLAKEEGARSTARFDVAVVYEQKLDKAAERRRLEKEVAKLEAEIASAERQLSNQQFLAKAPAHVVERMRKSLQEKKILLQKARAALEGLR